MNYEYIDFSSVEDLEAYGRTDQALKKDLDFEFDMNYFRAQAEERWQIVHELMRDKKWAQIIEQFLKEDHSDNSDNLKELLGFLRLISRNTICSLSDIKYMLQFSFKEYVEFESLDCFDYFSLITSDGRWYGSDPLSLSEPIVPAQELDWRKFIKKTIEKAPDDILLSVYDCHI